MKNLKDIITEKLVITKDTKLANNININITSDVSFSSIDINKIKEFANSLSIKPYVISNKHYRKGEIIICKNIIYLYYYEDYLRISDYEKLNKTPSDEIVYIYFTHYDSGYGSVLYMGTSGITNLRITGNDTIDKAIGKIKNEIKTNCSKYL